MAADRKEIIQRVNEAFAENNLEKVLSFCADDFAWTMVGDSTVRGKDAIRKWLASMEPQPPQLTVRDIVAEGDVVISRGDMTMPNGKNGAAIPYSFCDIYRFSGDKVAELTAFVIRTDNGDRAAGESSELATAVRHGGSLVAGVGLGAAAMYFLDPNRGARRRALVRDTAVHSANVARRGAAKAARDVWHRAAGTAASIRHPLNEGAADDRVLEERVRAKLGRVVSHPHAIRVEVTDCVATVSGPILDREADRLLRAADAVPGIHGVTDRLERHQHAGDHPSLQGGRTATGDRPDWLQENWAPATRAAAGAVGLLLVALAARRRDRLGLAAAAVGAACLGRAATNTPLGRLAGLSGNRGAADWVPRDAEQPSFSPSALAH